MQVALISVFPEMLSLARDFGVTGRAARDGLLDLMAVDPRDFTLDRHRSVDDRPYGGGPGMVMRPEPLAAAIDSAKSEVSGPVIYLSPQGRRFDDALARELAQGSGMILVAGRYEGVDERLIESRVDIELSVGDYVVSGGELPALLVTDAVARHVPGVLGHADSAEQDSFADGLLDCPHYTRPETFEDAAVPAVLLSGDHAAIDRWRREQALHRTAQRRPDLLEALALRGGLTDAEMHWFQEFKAGQGQPQN